jgi:predicted nicotinamide N-methyase
MGTLWASSVVLSRWILKNDTIFNIKNTQKQKKLCLELGSGCGLVGLSLLIKNMDVKITES